MMKIRVLSGILFGVFCGLNCIAQIKVSQIDPAQWVKESLTGKGVVIGNVEFHGNILSAGAFTSLNGLDVKSGLVLSTGLAAKVSGLNNKPNETYSFGDAGNDSDLKAFIKPNLYDISLIEFDFVPLANSFQFNYQFGSEEYPEYVGSAYNDVFGFFVSADSVTKNIAIIPGQDIPVSINTINHTTNSDLFIDNNLFSNDALQRLAPVFSEKTRGGFFSRLFSSKTSKADDGSVAADAALLKKVSAQLYKNLQLDGITKKLTAQTYLVPYKKYHLKIIIADVADNIYDSGVFIESNSLSSTRDTAQSNFIDYPDLDKWINPKLLLSGKALEDLLPDTVCLSDASVYFDFDKADISPADLSKLRGVSAVYNRVKAKYSMHISGHTDSIGNLEYNMNLSRERNQAVMNALQNILPIDGSVEITEDAFLRPAQSNETEAGRAKNRRVELFLIKEL